MREYFLDQPNIPKNKVILCAISAGFQDIKASLESMGIEVLEIEPHKSLQKPVAAHADMQLHDLGGGRVVIAKGATKLANELKKRGFSFEEQEIGKYYPDDIPLNCFTLNNKLFGKCENISEVLLKYYQSIDIEQINITQGYAKCSTCIVNDNSIITSDSSIAKAAVRCGIGVLQIQSGSISLSGYSTGFIGGCCGLLDKNILAFCGKISQHPDFAAIEAFCKSRQVRIIELDSCDIVDIGGILPLAVKPDS